MKVLRIPTLALAMMLAITLVTIPAALPAYAQSTDTAAERARLANERIQLEAQRRAEEERQRREREALESEIQKSENRQSEAQAQAADAAPTRTDEQPRPRAAPAATETATAPAAAPPPLPPAGDDRISRALEQLRELGELRDAGYVTDEEFERIKTRILDSRF